MIELETKTKVAGVMDSLHRNIELGIGDRNTNEMAIMTVMIWFPEEVEQLGK